MLFRPHPSHRGTFRHMNKYPCQQTQCLRQFSERRAVLEGTSAAAMANKPLNAPMQCSDAYLEEVEQQACLLFEEFLRLPEPVSRQRPLLGLSGEVADAPANGVSLVMHRARKLAVVFRILPTKPPTHFLVVHSP